MTPPVASVAGPPSPPWSFPIIPWTRSFGPSPIRVGSTRSRTRAAGSRHVSGSPIDSRREYSERTMGGGSMKAARVQTLILLLISLDLPGGNAYGQKPRDVARKVTVATVQSKDVTITH